MYGDLPNVLGHPQVLMTIL